MISSIVWLSVAQEKKSSDNEEKTADGLIRNLLFRLLPKIGPLKC